MRLKMTLPDLCHLTIENEEALWAWLDAHHSQADSVLLVTYKAADKQRYVSRTQVLDALIAYGWIDGRRYVYDEAKTAQLISPRKQQKWAKSYRDRYEGLAAVGRLHAAGIAAAEWAKAHDTWLVDEDVDAGHTPDDLKDCLLAAQANHWWEAAAPSYRRNILRWLKSAKTQKTREARLQKITAACEAGEKIPHF